MGQVWYTPASPVLRRQKQVELLDYSVLQSETPENKKRADCYDLKSGRCSPSVLAKTQLGICASLLPI